MWKALYEKDNFSFVAYDTMDKDKVKVTLYCHFWNLSWDIRRLPRQPPRSTWTYVSTDYDTRGGQTRDLVYQSGSLRHRGYVTILHLLVAFNELSFPKTAKHHTT